VAPWGRPLATVFAAGLRAQGAEVLVVSTGSHYEAVGSEEDVVLVTGSTKQLASWGSLVSALRVARQFRPDVVITEELADPRLLPVLRLAPVAVLVHDDAPHDETEMQPWHRRAISKRVAQQADLLVTFSEFVARHARSRWNTPVITVPLPSEAPQTLVPPLVTASDRSDMVMLGRINPYKDAPTTLAAWAIHVGSPSYRGDELIIIGDGNETVLELPTHCSWLRERFQFADVLPTLARAKASVVHYRSATQSGVQVTSMQCGTAAVISDAGGLPEYLPPGGHSVPVGDAVQLATAFDDLADPTRAATAGAAARVQYDSFFTQEIAAGALLAQLRRWLLTR